MIDVSTLKAPGWQRVVAELLAPAPDDRVYMERLLRVMAQVSAARQAVLYLPDRSDGEEVDPRVELVWPPPEMDKDAQAAAQAVSGSTGGVGAEGSVQFASETRTAARAAFSSAQARAFGLDKQETYYGEGAQSGFVLATPIPAAASAGATLSPTGQRSDQPAAVITMIIEPRSKDAIRSTLAMLEVLAGYAGGHHARSALKRTQAASFALDLATRLIASANVPKTFKGACVQVCNDLAKQFNVDRVALGFVKGDRVQVQAISDIEHFDKRTRMVQQLAAAMEECLDQEQPVLFPPPPEHGAGSDVLLSQAIVHAHRELAAGGAGATARLKIASLPMRVDESIVGVVTIESGGEGAIDIAAIELLQAALDVVAPVLALRKSDDRWLALRAVDSAKRAGAWAVGVKHTGWKLASLAALAALIAVTFVRITYRPTAEAMIEPREKRLVSAPFDGVVRALGENVEPGKRVNAGQVLVELDTREYVLGLADAQAQLAAAETQAAASRKAKDMTKVAQAQTQEDRARAQAALYMDRIARSKIVAPISGVVLAGEMKDKVGSTVKLGDPLMQIAPMDDLVLTAKVDDRDIGLVKRAFEEGRGAGLVATKGAPQTGLSFKVERIVPLAQAGEGKNYFEVRGALTPPPKDDDEAQRVYASLAPGIEGVAKFDTERRSLLWIGTRRLLDQARLWLWW